MNELKQQLATLHNQLTALKNPDGETRQLLGVLLADISRVLRDDSTGESSPVENMESIAARFDAGHPELSGALRQLLDALAKAGI